MPPNLLQSHYVKFFKRELGLCVKQHVNVLSFDYVFQRVFDHHDKLSNDLNLLKESQLVDVLLLRIPIFSKPSGPMKYQNRSSNMWFKTIGYKPLFNPVDSLHKGQATFDGFQRISNPSSKPI